MYLYETHLHTSPVSTCGKASVRETLEYYKSAGYAGVFMTEHFIDSNFDRAARELPYADKIRHYFSSYENGKAIGDEIGLAVFPGIEMGHRWTHFLVYGIDMEWCLAHPGMDQLSKSELLKTIMEEDALIVHAHPFRDVADELIHLYPHHVHGVEIYNSARTDGENALAAQYCQNYGLIPMAGSDNHRAGAKKVFGGVMTDRPIADIRDFIQMAKSGELKPFRRDENGVQML